jgi:hypothetical protein
MAVSRFDRVQTSEFRLKWDQPVHRGAGGEGIGKGPGVLDDSDGVATGSGTSNPGFVTAAGLVFSTGGSWNGKEPG